MEIKKLSLASSFLALLTLSYIYFPESIDDAYITLRFSRNLLLGNGPIFNIGERVEGYSNFSWMVFLAAFGRTGVPMEMAMKFLGLASGLGSLVLVWKLSAKWFKSDAAVGTAAILLGFSSFFAVWSVDGLETMFYTLFLTALVYSLTTVGTSSLLIGVIAGVVALTRPEGIMFSLIAVVYLAFRNGFVSGFTALVPVGICAGGYEVFRFFYFGEFISNTALAKVHLSLDTVISGLRYLFAYNAASGYLVLPAVLVGMTATKKNTHLVVPIVFVLAQILFLTVSGGDFMYAYRFVIPVIPCIALLCASAVDVIDERVNQSCALSALVILAASQTIFQYNILPEKHIGVDNLTFRSAPHFTIAKFLAQNSGPSDWIVLSEAGIIPYFIDAKVVDYLGLTSPFYSVFRPDHTIDNSYIFSAQPKFVVISFVEDQSGSIEPRMPVEAEIQAYLEFRQRYKTVRSFDIPKDSSFLGNIYYYYSPKAKRIFFTVFERS